MYLLVFKHIITILYLVIIVWGAFFAIGMTIPIDALIYIYFSSVGFMIVFNILLSIEAISSKCMAHCTINNNDNNSNNNNNNKHFTIIIPCYVPNEIDTIKTTIDNIIKCNKPDNISTNIIVVYNGPTPQQNLQFKHILDEFNILSYECIDSTTKAENINYVLDNYYANYENQYFIIFDADHHPNDNYFEVLNDYLNNNDPDILQGRCMIDTKRGSNIIGVEFDIIYCIFHRGGYNVKGFAYFGGSNGVWKYNVLKEIRMDPSMLTEDIDSSLRALLQNYKIEYCNELITKEESPPKITSWFNQRFRWAQGWSQVAFKYFIDIFNCKNNLTFRQRLGLFCLLPLRELYYYIAVIAMPIGIAYIIRVGTPEVIYSTVISSLIIFSASLTMFAYINAMPNNKPFYWYMLYAIISVVYDFLKFCISIISHCRNILGINKWSHTIRHHTIKDNTENSSINNNLINNNNTITTTLEDIDIEI